MTETYLLVYIYEEPGAERDTEGVSYVVLAAEVALVIVGLLFIFNFRRRERKEEARRREMDKEDAD